MMNAEWVTHGPILKNLPQIVETFGRFVWDGHADVTNRLAAISHVGVSGDSDRVRDLKFAGSLLNCFYLTNTSFFVNTSFAAYKR